MPRFPKDRSETLSLCYQVLAEDLEAMLEFTRLTALYDEDPELVEKLASISLDAREKSKKLSLKIVDKDKNIISVNFEKKDKNK